MPASPLPLRRAATALALILPLGVLPAAADQRSWVDPPTKSAAGPATKPAAPTANAAKDAPSPAARSADTSAPPAVASAKAPARPHHAKAAQHRRAVAEAPRPRRRRLADIPAEGQAVRPGPAAAPSGRIEAAQSLAMDYLAAVSAPGEAMVGAAPRFYGTRVRFYGRPTTLAALLDEKRGFVRRWPERRYAARAFSTQCSPDGASCIVRAIVDFQASNPQRGAVSRGASELVLEVSFTGERPVIVAESGRILHRDGRGADRAETLAQAGGRG